MIQAMKNFILSLFLTFLVCTCFAQTKGLMYSVSTEIGNNLRKNTGFASIDVAFTPGYAFDGRFSSESPSPSPTSCSARTAYRPMRATSEWASAPDTTSCRTTTASYRSAPLSEEASTPNTTGRSTTTCVRMGHFRLLQTARRTRSTLLPVARQHRQRPSLPLRQHRVPLQLTSPRTFAAGCRFVTAPCLP